MDFRDRINTLLQKLAVFQPSYLEAQKIHSSGAVSCIWHGIDEMGFQIDEENGDFEELAIRPGDMVEEAILIPEISPKIIACLFWLKENYLLPESKEIGGKIYTRQGMINRVLLERRDKSRKLGYRVMVGKTFYGDHILYNEKNEKYSITLWDFEKYQGYINNIDWKTNKLSTTKHIIFLCDYINQFPEKFNHLPRVSPYLEITLDPQHNYELHWKFIGEMNVFQKEVVHRLFSRGETHLPIQTVVSKVPYIRSLEGSGDVVVRPEVYEKLATYFDDLLLQQKKAEHTTLDFSDIKAELFPYQKDGVSFCLFRKAAIIADEMGLGKTLQAISTAILKRKYLDFRNTLIICPSSVKYQWKKEIFKFTQEDALVVEGFPANRKEKYLSKDHFFFIVNYETVMRDFEWINSAKFDFIILDEAQKIKNFENKTSNIISSLHKEHGLILTGTPIENKLSDLYSIILFLDKYKVTPLWEFSYQHCVFDKLSHNKINGYYNLTELKAKVADLIIRRQKKEVLQQLPTVLQKDIFISLSEPQAGMHARFGHRLAQILSKRFKTTFDWEQIMILLTNMRRVSNSTFLIDKTSHHSSKLTELEFILKERLDIIGSNKKMVIFSEWVDSLFLIEQLLEKLQIGYVKLTGSVPSKKRGELIQAFQNREDIQVFLSTEAGGTGLNLQFADTLINFEIPWNPAKKNQRIGRIDRIGQESSKLHIFNLICRDSIEIKIASGLMLKQNLFDNVLNQDTNEDTVDFSNEGKAQFIKMLEEMLDFDENGFLTDTVEEEEMEVAEETEEGIVLTEEPEEVSSNGRSSMEYEKLEQVLTKGMEFLSGLFEMSTGEKLGGTDGHKITVDKETGEVTLKFKFKM